MGCVGVPFDSRFNPFTFILRNSGCLMMVGIMYRVVGIQQKHLLPDCVNWMVHGIIWKMVYFTDQRMVWFRSMMSGGTLQMEFGIIKQVDLQNTRISGIMLKMGK